jgi:hypothetical protein
MVELALVERCAAGLRQRVFLALGLNALNLGARLAILVTAVGNGITGNQPEGSIKSIPATVTGRLHPPVRDHGAVAIAERTRGDDCYPCGSDRQIRDLPPA